MLDKKILFVFCIGFFFSCSDKNRLPTEKAKDEECAIAPVIGLSRTQLQDLGIQLTKVKKRAWSHSIDAYGEIVALPTDQATVNSKVRGIVERVFIEEGTNVKKGAPLFVLSSPDIIDWQDQYLKAKGQLIYLKKERGRQRSLVLQNVSAKKALEQIESEYFQALSLLKVAQSKLENVGMPLPVEQDSTIRVRKEMIIRAPIDGNVVQVMVNLGAFANENMGLCRIVRSRDLHAHVQIHPQEATLINVGMKVDIYINNSTQPIYSNVEYISREINATTKTLSFHVAIPSFARNVLPGMPVRVKIHLKEIPALTAPLTALIYNNQQHYLFYQSAQRGDSVFFTPYYLDSVQRNDQYVILPSTFDSTLPIVVSGVHFLDGELHKGDLEE